MAQEINNLTRLTTLQELAEDGCAFGQVNRERIKALDKRIEDVDEKRKTDIEEVKDHLKTMDGRLWAILAGVVLQLAGIVVYFLTQAQSVKAMLPGG